VRGGKTKRCHIIGGERGKRIRHIIVKCIKNKRKRGKNKTDISKGTPRSLLALKTMGEI
jgi:hypothetical protein